ncbi:MAG TPA: shikimate dehydrogenase [Blastocatellia bacterium]|nr:shikimate dehydrogenase [Blastocatellia bacterium]
MAKDSPARNCAVITEETVAAARARMKDAAQVADMIEIRLDYLRDFDFTKPEDLSSLLEDKALPVIITCRSVAEGGRQAIDDQIRLRLLVEGARNGADYCDIEATHYDQAASLAPDPSRLILSHHNFQETPPDLFEIYYRQSRQPAAVHKIVTQANSVIDTLSIFHLLKRAREEGQNLIALAMGEPGVITRILGPAAGGYLTYGSLARGAESAPGQLTCRELQQTYRVHQLSRETTITGIIGRPVSQSASPAMHNAAFQECGLDFVYLPIEVDDLEQFFVQFVREESREFDWQLRGLSVTIPYKTAVIPMLDEVDETARDIGAVNTVVIEHDCLKGYNTDVEGAIKPLEKVCSIKGESFGVIGAGGAARAVLYGLQNRGARVTLFARDTDRARGLADSAGVEVYPINALDSSHVRVIINTTPVGMRGHDEGSSPVRSAAFRGRLAAYDLVYNPMETKFLKDAREEGCQTISGIEMLVAQGARQFEMWTARKAPTDLMFAAALEKLDSQSR